MKRLTIYFIIGFFVKLCFPAGITLTQTPGSLYRETSSILVGWQEPVQAHLKFGLSSGNYTFQSSASGTKQLNFVPKNEGMTPGVYYCIISSGSLTSREFKLYIESGKAPIMQTPVNNSVINSAIPSFSWDPVAGVPFYHLILSDQPVELSEDANGELLLNGGNIIWQVITSKTNVLYGEADPSGFFAHMNKNLPPILKGLEYNWVVLNNYSNHPAYSSIVQAGVSGFTVNLSTTLAAPVLLSPQNNSTLQQTNITFRWSPVAGASTYQLLLSESIEQDGSESSYIVWGPVTTETSIDLPARQMLKGLEYFWRVVVLDQAGRGTGSEVRQFTYSVPTATLVFRTTDTKNKTLPRVEIDIVPQNGSSEISKLLSADNGVLEQPVQPGDYTIFGRKSGFVDTSTTASLKGGETVNVSLVLRELVQSINGLIVDQRNQPLPGARVRFNDFQNSLKNSVISDDFGRFNIFLAPGSWYVWAEKSGYSFSDTSIVRLNTGQQKTLAFNLKLVEKAAKIIGSVKTTNGIPVVNCQVRAENDTELFSTFTDNIGGFELALSSGAWSVFAEKDGFTASTRRTVLLSADQTLTLSPDLTLSTNASIVFGIVSTAEKTLPSVAIEAIPLRGQVVKDITNPKGSYLLSLEKGAYKLRALSKSFIPENEFYLELAEKETLTGMDFFMTATTCQINGFVKFNNSPVIGAIVTNGTNSDTTKSDGSYRLFTTSGANTIQSYFKGQISTGTKSVNLKDGQVRNNVNFSMTRAGVIEGKVLSGGQNVPYAHITAKAGNNIYTFSGQKDGSYWISVPPGVWNLSAQKVGFETGAFNGVAVNNGQTISGVDFNLNFTGAVLRGQVTDAANNGVQNVQLEIEKAEVVASTDRYGNYAVSLDPGNYTILAQKTGFVNQQKVASVSKNQTTTLNFKLAAQGTIRGFVKDQSGQPLDRIDVTAIGPDTLRSKTDHAGEYVLYMNAGSYRLMADQLGYAAGQTNVSITLGQTIIKDFTLANAPNEIAKIKGQIYDSENEAMQGVGFRISGFSDKTFYSDVNGLFDTDILETGKNYTIQPFSDGRFFVPSTRSYSPLTANQNNQNFQSGLFGDVSANENISSFDGSLVLRVKAEQDVSPFYKNMPRDSISADVSGNNQVSPFDASLIFRYAAGLIDEFPTEGTNLAKPSVAAKEKRAIALDIKYKNSNQIQVDLLLENNTNVYSGEFELVYDREFFGYLFSENTNIAEGTYYYTTEKPGAVKIVFAALQPISNSDPIASLVFETKKLPLIPDNIRIVKARVNENNVKIKTSVEFNNAPFSTFKLFGNYPNPFNSSTKIRYILPTFVDVAEHDVELKIYNILGQPIKTLVNTTQPAGFYEKSWDGSNDMGHQVPSGIYIYQLKAGPFKDFRKILLVK